MTVDHDWAYPLAWRARMGELSGRVRLTVAGIDVQVDITRQQLRSVYLPLIGMLDRRSHERHQRLIACLAGIPGCGKSSFAAVLVWLAGRLLPPAHLVAVGMDGWHWPNAVLDARMTLDGAGREIPLRERKGSPESFDVAGLAAALQELHLPEQKILLPAYDRRQHEPVAGALAVEPQTRIVFLEGNYVLCQEPPWNELAPLLDLKLFLDCDPAEARQQIIARHIQGGATPEEALTRFEMNDGPNTQIVLASAANADLYIRLAPTPSVGPKRPHKQAS